MGLVSCNVNKVVSGGGSVPSGTPGTTFSQLSASGSNYFSWGGMSDDGTYMVYPRRLNSNCVVYTTNGGVSFNGVTGNNTNADAYGACCSASGQYMFVATPGDSLVSQNYGSTWTRFAGSGANPNIECSDDGQVVLGGGFSSSVLQYSTNGGTSWSTISPNGRSDVRSVAVSGDGGTILFGSSSGQVYKSTNGGSSWTAVPVPNGFYYCLTCNYDGQYILAGLWGGAVYRSVNGGSSVSLTGLPSANYIDACISNDGRVTYVTNNSGAVYIATDYGAYSSYTTVSTPANSWGTDCSRDGVRCVHGVHGGYLYKNW